MRGEGIPGEGNLVDEQNFHSRDVLALNNRDARVCDPHLGVYVTPLCICTQKYVAVSSGGAPTPAGRSVFTKHNWDTGMEYLLLNGWGIY